METGCLGYEVPVKYELHSRYNDPNDTVADQAWDAIDTSPVVVALSDDYALSHGLELSVRFPWDANKGIYHVKAFHHLHCLVRPLFFFFSPFPDMLVPCLQRFDKQLSP